MLDQVRQLFFNTWLAGVKRVDFFADKFHDGAGRIAVAANRLNPPLFVWEDIAVFVLVVAPVREKRIHKAHLIFTRFTLLIIV